MSVITEQSSIQVTYLKVILKEVFLIYLWLYTQL